MKPGGPIHLDEDQLLVAVVDRKDLAQQQREHLAACPRCAAEKARLEKSLAALGKMARDFSPAPGRRVTFPVAEARRRSLWPWVWSPALRVAVAAVLVMAVVWWSGIVRPPEDEPGTPAAAWEADRVMAEVGLLVENALPEEYLSISGENYVPLDEDFMRFVVPPTEADPVSSKNDSKGAQPC